MNGPTPFPFRSHLGRLRRRLRGQTELGWRPASFPFISGDTFRACADVIVESDSDLGGLADAVHSLERPVTVFSWEGVADQAIQILLPDLADRVRLIVHNGDVIPEETLRETASAFESVFCTNWLDTGFPYVTPLPIGLENAHRNINGRVQDFQDCLPSRRPAQLTRSRRHTALCAVRTWTNEGERAALPDLARSVPKTLVPRHRLSVARHREEMSDAYFVFSPPGNGPDCHRTWEAIYRGAIPIVLRRAWAFESLNLPVLVVDDWDEAIELLSDKPVALYRELQQRNPAPAYAEFHLDRITGGRRPPASPVAIDHPE